MLLKLTKKPIQLWLALSFLLAIFSITYQLYADDLQINNDMAKTKIKPIEFQEFEIQQLDTRLAEQNQTTISLVNAIDRKPPLIQEDSSEPVSLFYSPVRSHIIGPEFNSNYWKRNFRVADIDGDERADLIYVVYEYPSPEFHIFFQEADGTFLEPTIINRPEHDMTDLRWDIVDIENDGLMEIIYAHRVYPTTEEDNDQGIQIIRQASPRNFEAQPLIQTEILATVSNKVVGFDFNNDSFNDIGYLHKEELGGTSPNVYIWKILLNNGNGEFEQETAGGKITIEGGLNTAVRVEEISGALSVSYRWWERDDVTDKVTNFFAIDQLKDGVFQRVTTIDFPGDNGVRDYQFADLNDDGKDELVLLTDPTNAIIEPSLITILFETSENNFGNPIEINVLPNIFPTRLIVEDVNQDGQKDIIGRTQRGQLVLSLLNKSLQQHDQYLINLQPPNGGNISYQERFPFFSDDFNQDGFPDLIMENHLYLHNTLLHELFISSAFNKYINYRDYFDDFGNPSSGWPVLSNEVVENRYINGEYSIHNKDEDYLGLALIDHPAIDYELSVVGRTHGGSRGGYGLLVEATDDLSYFKGILIFPHFGVAWIIDVGPDGRLRVLNERRDLDIIPGHNINVKARRLSSGTLTVFVNDTSVLGTSSNWELERHRVGLITLPLDDGFEVRFDNFFLDYIED